MKIINLLSKLNHKQKVTMNLCIEGFEMSEFNKEFAVRGGTNCEPVWQKCKVLFEGEKFIVVVNENGREFSRRKAKIQMRDVDTRTDKEKIIDAICDAIHEKTGGYSEHITTSIIEGKIPNVIFTGELK